MLRKSCTRLFEVGKNPAGLFEVTFSRFGSHGFNSAPWFHGGEGRGDSEQGDFAPRDVVMPMLQCMTAGLVRCSLDEEARAGPVASRSTTGDDARSDRLPLRSRFGLNLRRMLRTLEV